MPSPFQNHIVLAAKMVPLFFGTLLVSLGCLYMYQHRNDEPADEPADEVEEDGSNPWQFPAESAVEVQPYQPPGWVPPPDVEDGGDRPRHLPVRRPRFVPHGRLP
jgi:hypothetical protein